MPPAPSLSLRRILAPRHHNHRATTIRRHPALLPLLPFPLPLITHNHPRHLQSATITTTTDAGAAAAAEPHSLSAADAASTILERFDGRTRMAKQVLDANQLRKLSLTLGRRWPGRRPPFSHPGAPVPPGYHLVYFTPDCVEAGAEGEGEGDELGADGSDLVFNAPAPFTRRMWVGGRMRWFSGGDMGLRVGDEAREETRLVAAVPKTSRSGDDMVLVRVEKEFWGSRGLALIDERSWIFQRETPIASPAAEGMLRDAVIKGPSTWEDVFREGGYPQRRLRWSPTGLFRFSALTFNGHKLHYDPAWSATVEGHPACVVHGPLNLISMLNYWRDHCAGNTKQTIREINYRAMAPIYAGETYEISTEGPKPMKTGGGSQCEVLVTKNGMVCMKGEIMGE